MRPDETIRMEHGAGGALSRELVEEVIYPALESASYPELLDATTVRTAEVSLLTTDTYVVDPPFFPGGDIGRLAVFGTCNDLAVSGAQAQYLTIGLVLEEGFPVRELRRALDSLAIAAREAGVVVVSGDTKVVPAGKGGGLYVNSTGLGRRVAQAPLTPRVCRPEDAVILSGPVGAHGIAVLAAREGLRIGEALRSDCACLWPLCRDLLALGTDLRFMRDATRGGLAAVANETVAGTARGMFLREADIPVTDAVRTAADLLGLEPLEIANEGVFLAVVSAASKDRALGLLRAHALGARAAAIGELTSTPAGRVVLETRVGGHRLLDFPRGLALPRIC